MNTFFRGEQSDRFLRGSSTYAAAMLSVILTWSLAQELQATTFLQYRVSREIEFTQNSAADPASQRAQLDLEADEFRDPRDPDNPSPTPIVLGIGTNHVVTPGTGASPIALNVSRESDSSLGTALVDLGAGTSTNAFETTYSTGSYRFELTGDTHSLSMVPFPDILPRIQNAATDWNGGVLVFDPTQDFTVLFDAFASQVRERTFSTNRRDSAFLTITNQDSSKVQRSESMGTTVNSFVIPAGTFAPGETLSGELQFTRFFERLSFDETSSDNIVVSNALVSSLLLTRFELVAVPEPSTSLLMAIGGIMMVVRRRRK